MTKLHDDIRLRHMLDAAKQALTFIQGKSREALDTEPMLLLAILKSSPPSFACICIAVLAIWRGIQP